MAGGRADHYPGPVQIGPYTVLEQIASGGQGVVFRAQGPDGRPVALKVLLGASECSPDDASRARWSRASKARSGSLDAVRA